MGKIKRICENKSGMTIKFVFKSGYELKTKCTRLEFVYDEGNAHDSGWLCRFDTFGTSENLPIVVDLKSVDAIIRLVSDEKPPDGYESEYPVFLKEEVIE